MVGKKKNNRLVNLIYNLCKTSTIRAQKVGFRTREEKYMSKTSGCRLFSGSSYYQNLCVFFNLFARIIELGL